MAEDLENKDKEAEKGKEKEGGGGGGVTSYLKTPKRKKRSFVTIALGPSFDPDLGIAIETFVNENFSLGVLIPKNERELKRALLRQISLIVLDDEFIGLTECMRLVRGFKEKRHIDSAPTLFLTREPERLIKAYRDILLPYQESDEYVVYPSMPIKQVLSCIKSAIDKKSRRRSRRYSVDIPVTYSYLGETVIHHGRFTDLSVHGALIKAEGGDPKPFKESRQLRLTIDVRKHLTPDEGEFLKVSARVQRVFISGKEVWSNNMSRYALAYD